jgi:hypothetical protein
METLALKTLTATEATLILSIEPIFGTFFATIIVGERLGHEFAIGALLIVSACIYSNLGWTGLMDFICRRHTTKERESDAPPDLIRQASSGSSSRFAPVLAIIVLV